MWNNHVLAHSSEELEEFFSSQTPARYRTKLHKILWSCLLRVGVVFERAVVVH